MKIKRPEYYALPLKSRAAIADFLLSHRGYRAAYHDPGSLFAWDVKLYGLDLSWEKIAEKGRHEHGYRTRDWWEAAERVYRGLDDTDRSDLEEWASSDARDNVNGTDCYNSLWDGTPLDVEYQFAGRSGGYIILTKFEGYDLTELSLDWPAILRGTDEDPMPWPTLRKLYETVVMRDHEWTRAKACEEVEYLAASTFFSHWEDEIDAELARVQSAAMQSAVSAATINPTVEQLALAG